MAIHLRGVAVRTWRSVLRITLLLVITFAIMLAMLLGTEGGRIALVKQGLNAWSLVSKHKIELVGLRSQGIGQWQVGQIRITEIPALPLLELTDVELNWRWRYAIQNRWWVSDLSAQSVKVEMAQPSKAGGEQFSVLYDNWSKIPAIRLERFHIQELTVARPRYPNLTGELNGHAELNWGAIPARFLIGMTQADSQNNYAVQLSAESIDKIRLQGSLQAQAHSNWARWIKWSLDEPAQANWDVKIDYSRPGFLTVDIDDWRMPWQGYELTALGQFEYDIDAVKLNFSPLALAIDQQPAELQGWLQARQSELYLSVEQWPIDPFAQFFNQPELAGIASIEANWLGGWEQPRLEGQLEANGAWLDYPFNLTMNSQAGLSSLNITQGRVKLSNNEFSLSGNLDWLTEELDFNFTGELSTDPLLREYLPDSLVDVKATASTSGQISGRYRQPKVTADVKAQGQWRDDDFKAASQVVWQQDELSVDDLYLYSAPLKFNADLNANLTSGQWQTDVTLTELREAVLERIAVQLPVEFNGAASGQLNITGQGKNFLTSGNINVLGRWQQWPLNAHLAIQNLTPKQLLLSGSTVRLGDAESIVLGSIDWSNRSLDLRLNHKQWPLATLPPWFELWPNIMDSLAGQLSGQTHLYGLWSRPAIASDSQLVGQWLGEPLKLNLKTQPRTATDWQVPKFELEWLGSQWRYSGDFQPYALWLDGNLSVEKLQAEFLPLLSGTFTQAEKRLPELLDVALTADMRINGKITEPELAGSAQIQGIVDGQPFDISAAINQLTTRAIDIEQGTGRWANGDWQLAGRYDWQQNLWAMSVETQTEDTAYLVPWLSLVLGQSPNFSWLQHWAGSLHGKMKIDNQSDDWQITGDLASEGTLYGDDYQLNWQGEGQLNKALNHQISSQWGVAELSAELVSDSATVDGVAQMRSVSFEQIRQIIPSLSPLLAGVVNAELEMSGPWQNPNIALQVSSKGQIDALNPHRFNADMTLKGTADDWQIEQAVVEIPNAIGVTVAGFGQRLQGELTIEGVLPDTRYWIPNAEIGPGEAAFNIAVQGALMEPSLTGAFEWRAENWPIALRAQLATGVDQYQLETSLYSQQETRIKSTLEVSKTPLLLWPSQWKSHAINVSTVINSPLTVLDPLFIDRPDLKIAGNLTGQLNLTGSLDSPQWQGDLHWQDGRFEHAAYGSLVNDVNLSISGQQRQWQISGLANDGDRGVISLAGFIDFISQEQTILAHDINLNVGFGDAHLLNQAQMDATVSGALAVSGSYHELLLAGELFISPLTLQSDTFLWDGAPQLNIISDETKVVKTDQGRPFYWPDGQWQVQLVAENRVNLYGQGISAELTGQLALTENLYQPEIAGRFNLVRGTYSGLGKVFQLDSGSVQLQNNQLVLDIQGSHTAKMQIDEQTQQLPIVLRIRGNQDELNLELSTTTADLDQDEILAQLLFGKIVADLDVVQAIQLANVINKLRTGNSGFDIIGATRDSFDLDSLVIDTDSDEEGNLRFNVSAGKYINDFLYLEVEQDVGTELEIRGSLQFQVTPSTNLELYTQGDGGQFEDSGIELNWSWDY